MDKLEAIKARHSVRSYTDEAIDADTRALLQAEVDRCNAQGGLHMQLMWDEPQAFDSTLAHYGRFLGVRNYLVIAGPAAPDLAERGGYFGERVVLLAQQLGLNTCWVALTFKKRHVKKMIGAGDKLVLVVALGHGATQGVARKSKDASEVSKVPDGTQVPAWFDCGVAAALLAPTAINQQRFMIELVGTTDEHGRPLVRIESKGGTQAMVDLGIVRLHFEVGAGEQSFAWAD